MNILLPQNLMVPMRDGVLLATVLYIRLPIMERE